MTVSELIEELRKRPGHWRVFVEHPNINLPDAPELATDYASVVDVQVKGDCCVVIDATGGVQ